MEFSNVDLKQIIDALINNPQGAALIEQAQSTLNARKVAKPISRWLINKETGSVVPATEHNCKAPHLNIFNSSMALPFSTHEGMLWLNGGDQAVLEYRKSLEQDNAGDHEFDLISATKEQMINFAKSEFDVVLDARWNEDRLRKEIVRLDEVRRHQEA